MSGLIEKVARAMNEGEDGDLSPTDKWLARAAIAAVAEWLRQELSVDEHEPYVAAALMKQLEQPK